MFVISSSVGKFESKFAFEWRLDSFSCDVNEKLFIIVLNAFLSHLGNSTVPFLFISHYYYNHGQDLVISKSWGWKPGPLPHGGGFASRELNPLLLTAG